MMQSDGVDHQVNEYRKNKMLARVQYQFLIKVLIFLVKVEYQVLVGVVNNSENEQSNGIKYGHQSSEYQAYYDDAMNLNEWISCIELGTSV